MSQTPFLIISDSPAGPTGLGRVAREVAINMHEKMQDKFRIAVCGYGGSFSRHLPFQQYPITFLDNWSIPELPLIWKDFAGSEKGIIFSIWNASWLAWFAMPEKLPDGDLKSFLRSEQFERWGYIPIDAEGPNFKLVRSQKDILERFDRLAAYTAWGAKVIDATLGKTGTEYLPHGTDRTVFYPRDRKESREIFIEKVVGNDKKGRLSDDVLLIGVVATNSQRKDWFLAFEVCHDLLLRGVNVGIWAHTDGFKKHWDLLSLADEFDMRQRVIFTNGHIDNEAMAIGYSACNVTLGIGSEGWGLPLSESLACGVPVVTGDYAGQIEFVPEQYRIKPAAFHGEGYYLLRRPVFKAAEWATKVLEVRDAKAELPERYYWENCWPEWEKWLRTEIKKEEPIVISTNLKMDYVIATVYQPKWRDCVKTWMDTNKSAHAMIVVPHKGVVDAYQEGFEKSKADVLAYIHDDVLIFEKDWDHRVMMEFEDPQVGLVGFLGATGHGDPEMYKKPYQLSQLGRYGVISNLKDAEHHGERFGGSKEVAVLDALAMFVRREVLVKAGGWPVNTEIDYIGIDYWISCMTRRLGYKTKVVGVSCQHLSGGSNGRNVKPIDFQGAHEYIYREFADVLPFKVDQ